MSEGPIVVGVDIQTPENMGLILRVSSNFGCKKVYFAHTSEGQPDKKNRKIRSTARNAFELLPWQYCQTAQLEEILPKDYLKLGLETSQGAKSVYQAMPLPRRVTIFLGSESHGLPQEIIEKLDLVYFIPMRGPTISMNVSHALASLLTLWAMDHS